MIIGPLMVIVFTIVAIQNQYQINSKAINEGHSVGFQFGALGPIVVGLSLWIVALLCKCQLLEERIAALEEKQQEVSLTKNG